MNQALSEKLITELVEIYGVSTFCLCPGGRNAPLISFISKAQGLEVFTFFEERSAGFFALGRCRRDKQPVAVVTTSGTAVAELLPAVIEAYYSNQPLILITADRPSSYRQTGAPQSIEQVGIFSHYVEQTLDLEKSLNFDFSNWSCRLPLHINICFDEPLLDQEIPVKIFSPKSQDIKSENPNSKESEKKVKDFFKKVKKPLCIVAETPREVREELEQILVKTSWPIYAEALSHLRESSKLQNYILKSGESFLDQLVENKQIDSVVRIGRRPCTRFWRNLEKKYSHLPVLSISDQSYSGLSRGEAAYSFNSFFNWSKQTDQLDTSQNQALFAEDKKQSKKVKDLISEQQELALIQDFSQKLAPKSLLFLGNSLPIREWDRVAISQPNKCLKYEANRGANGIDGLISTFLGLASAEQENWCLIGDLSCLYDLPAPWIFKQLDPRIKCFIVIINNGGGLIFQPLFKDPVFLNSHSLEFKDWARMWNLHYYSLTKWPETLSFSSPAVIELKIP